MHYFYKELASVANTFLASDRLMKSGTSGYMYTDVAEVPAVDAGSRGVGVQQCDSCVWWINCNPDATFAAAPPLDVLFVHFGLAVAAELRGEMTAREIQLMMEYDPEPPFDSGSPKTADRALVEEVRATRKASQEKRKEVIEQARVRLGL
ncbi:MAG: cyclohexyl-isocyanide hydratase [Rubrobacteraceae bacterium]|nr:cyclohexyl-isocyanide hydratase [Rubrobacteraceae bacterium]